MVNGELSGVSWRRKGIADLLPRRAGRWRTKPGIRGGAGSRSPDGINFGSDTGLIPI